MHRYDLSRIRPTRAAPADRLAVFPLGLRSFVSHQRLRIVKPFFTAGIGAFFGTEALGMSHAFEILP